MFELLGIDSKHKKLYVTPAAHIVPRDVLIRDRIDRFAAYRGRATGFDSAPMSVVSVGDSGTWSFGVADIDGDGRSDMVLSSPADEAGSGARVYLARESGE